MTTILPAALRPLLDTGLPALLLSVDAAGLPHSAYTWVVAPSETTLHLGVEGGTTTRQNLDRDPRAALHLIAPENQLYLIKGTVAWVTPRLESAPFDIGVMALTIQSVKDQTWPGVRVSPLSYVWDDPATMQPIEQAILAALRSR